MLRNGEVGVVTPASQRDDAAARTIALGALALGALALGPLRIDWRWHAGSRVRAPDGGAQPMPLPSSAALPVGRPD
ncbi:MAG: hypothetical protein KGL18_06665 [Burkholderiales bacterium]|nr:hypothetical protein [Burkholderiales bacterium]MDE1926511.1 hypothetical protein [Burkholderiales bacterium]MDE2502642.1 hypothetical protein [Burkholderiales bacterium]